MFEFDVKDDLERELHILLRKNPMLARAVQRKMQEIISRDKYTIMAYKNLRYGLKGYKRVHITGQWILLFVVDIEKNFVFFTHLKHRDTIYK